MWNRFFFSKILWKNSVRTWAVITEVSQHSESSWRYKCLITPTYLNTNAVFELNALVFLFGLFLPIFKFGMQILYEE